MYLSNDLLIPHYELITYPDGGLFTSINDYSLFLMEMIEGLNGSGTLLTAASYKTVMSNQLNQVNFPKRNFDMTKGIMWSVNRDGDNISMNGADPGIMTYCLFTLKGNVGIVFFTNKTFYGNESLEKDFNKVRGLLFKTIPKLLSE